MSNITSLRLWRDTGFTEGCLEVPKIGGGLGTPTYTFAGPFNPSTSDMFSVIKVRVPYVDVMDCSYLSIILDMNNGSDRTFYGWIDSISIISDTTGSPLTQINWHVDLWRTYIAQANIGSGMVKRRPLLTGDSVPPQSYPYRYKLMDSNTNFLTASTYYWVVAILSALNMQGDPIVTISFPVSPDSPNNNLPVTFKDGTSYTAPAFNDLVTGKWDELLGLDPASIYGVFLSPISPHANMTTWGGFGNKVGEVNYGTYMAVGLNGISEYSGSLPAEIIPDDVTDYVILGFDGELVGALPWGIPVSTYKYRLIIDTASAYVQIRFDGIKSHSEGLCFTIPLIPISLTSNAYSSYVYSGARQADIMQSRAEAEKARESALVGMASGVTSSVASSAMLGSLGGPVGTLGGALIGGASSVISGTIGATADYALTTKYNDVFQDITDYRMANQSNGLLMSGSGFDSVRFGFQEIMLAKLTMDEYSQEQRANDITLYGVHVSEPMESCQQLVTAGGPLQITNVTVKGPIPVEAKQYIRQRLAQGVRMI